MVISRKRRWAHRPGVLKATACRLDHRPITPHRSTTSPYCTSSSCTIPTMYNSYLGQQPPGQQGYQPQYQIPQQTGYTQPQQTTFQQQPPQFLQTQATGYLGTGGFQTPTPQQGQFGVPPVPAIPSQYVPQTPQMGMQPTGFQQQQPQFQQVQQQQPQPQQMQQQPTALSTPTGHQRTSSTAMGTSARIPNGNISP